MVDEPGVDVVVVDEPGVDVVVHDEPGVDVVVHDEPGVDVVVHDEPDVDVVVGDGAGVDSSLSSGHHMGLADSDACHHHQPSQWIPFPADAISTIPRLPSSQVSSYTSNKCLANAGAASQAVGVNWKPYSVTVNFHLLEVESRYRDPL